MKIEHADLQHRDAGARGGGEPMTFGRTAIVVPLAITLLVLLGIAAAIALRHPSSVAIAATYLYGPEADASGAAAQDRRAQPAGAGNKPEPFIADDIRMQGLSYAAAVIATPLPRPIPEPSAGYC